MRSLELRIPPLALTAIFAALIVSTSVLLPGLTAPFAYHRTVAPVFVGLGLAVLFGAALQFRLQRTTLDPRTPAKASRFVARGLFRFTRNPMYLGMALVLLGIAAWAAHVIGCLLVVIFCLYLTELQIKPEERALEQRFGQEYLVYKAAVRRWI